MPKGGPTSLIPVSAGLQDDLDLFLKAFLDLKSQRFSEYKKLFQKRQMIELYNGRSDSAEIIEFNELLLVSCLPYMDPELSRGTPRCLEERLFGLYSLYTFFYTQTVGHVTKIRIDPDSSRNFRQLTAMLLEMKIYDAYMACLKLLEDKAFKYVAFIQVYDPSLFKCFGPVRLKTPTEVVINVNDPLARVKELIKSDLFRKLGVVHNEYTRLKMAAGIDFDTEIPNGYEICKQSLERHQDFIKEKPQTMGLPIKQIKPEKQKMSRMEIREKAYNADLYLSRFRRHYTTNNIGIKVEKFEYDAPDDSDNVVVSKVNKPKAILKKPKPEPKEDFEHSEIKMEEVEVKIEPELETRKNERFQVFKTKIKQLSPEEGSQKTKRTRPPTPVRPPTPMRASSLKPSGRKTNNSLASEFFSSIGSSESEQTSPVPKKMKRESINKEFEENMRVKTEEDSHETKKCGIKRRAVEENEEEEEDFDLSDDEDVSFEMNSEDENNISILSDF